MCEVERGRGDGVGWVGEREREIEEGRRGRKTEERGRGCGGPENTHAQKIYTHSV